MIDFGDRSEAYVPFLLREWRALTRVRAPWRDMPPDDVQGELPRVASALVHEAFQRETSGMSIADALLQSAEAHGRFRRGQGCASEVIDADFDALRRALRNTLRRSGLPSRRCASVLYEAHAALRLAAFASARRFAETTPVGLEPFVADVELSDDPER
jgi:hypothetical protein